MTPVRFLRDLCIVLAITGLALWGVTRWLVLPWVGDRVLVDLWTVRTHDPRPGEVVVLTLPGGSDLVKRVGREPYPGSDPYPSAVIGSESPLEPTFVVLGDNPERSRDSREFGRVPRHCLRGRVVWRYWPLSRIGSIK